ncbi:putative P-loop containing nucleoside triphosphate hydrolase, leucine-rich repeat domain superfamily [Helianthus annuus]|nr:putative P-loop containing nucleoside triphosphate hydrolase, leucine-rich repeat domain superfamily [Helianthus annuus]
MEVVTGFAANLLAKIGEQLIVKTRRHLGYVFFYNNYVRSLEEQVKKLEVKSKGIILDVEEATRNGEIIAPQVDEWFTNVEIVFEESAKFLEKVKENKDIMKGWFPNIKRRYILGKKARKKTEKVAKLTTEVFPRISYPAPPLAVGDRSIKNFRNFESRIPTINKLMMWLKDDSKNIISLCGMGGSGKTTMVEEVARRVKGEKLFDEIIFTVVSKDHDLMKVQEGMAKGLGLRFKSQNLEGRADELWKRLLQSKKGNLVILDDVWKYIDLNDIGIPFGKEYNCKVLLTSRSEEACKAMGCNDILGLDILTQSETWSLLGEMVGESIHDPSLHETASEIAKKCGGLPIAIVCLGRALKDKRKEVWNDTLQKLQRSIVPENMEGVKEDVYKSLQLSYDLLDDKEAKNVFILCCLYPEYANVPLEALVRCGIGLDFFRGVDLLIGARDRVHALTDKLKSRFLLLTGDRKSTVKVHNVVRAVGISVASTSKLNMEQFSAMVIHEDRWPRGIAYKDYSAVSVVSNELSEIPSRGLNFQKLELLQLSCPQLSLEKLNTMFQGMNMLRVVELWNMSISSFSSLLIALPRDIFSLCMDCKMEHIGDIRPEEFKNLEILSLGNCDIKEVPMQMGKFVNLKLLDLSRCHRLERIAPGVISSLSQLEELDTGSKWWGEEEGDASLAELESLTNLIYLGIRITSLKILPKNSIFAKLQRYVISVGVHIEKTRSFNNRMLLLKHESTDTHLTGGIDKLLRKNTEKVFLSGDGMKTALKELVPGGFQLVKNLTVEYCNSEGMEYLSDYNYSSNGAGVFSNLEKLRMEKMWLLKGILRHNGQGLPTKSFSRLRKIHLSVLPEITYLFTQSVAKNLVLLESLHIEYCTNMKQVIFNPWTSTLESTTENKIPFPKLTELILNDVVSLICFSQGANLQVEFPQLKVLKLEYLQNFSTFCPEEVNLASKANYRGAKFQSLVNHKVEFSILAELTITNVANLKEVWSGHLPNLVHLQGLYIQFCHMMEEVISIQRPSITTIKERIVFVKLKEVILFGLNRLTYFCRGVDHIEFTQLRVLRLRWLTHFRTFCQEDTTDHPSSVFDDKVAFPNLETLEVSELDSVEELWSNQLATTQFGKLKSLRVDKCHKLINIFPSDLQTLFPSLEKLEVEKCDSLEHVWDSKGVQIRNLKSVHVYECPKLKNLCSFHTFKGLSNLQILDICRCKMMEAVVADDHKHGKINEVLSLNQLEEVKLAFLPNLNYFSHTKCDMELPELTQVVIKSCPDMYTFSVSSVITPNLKSAMVDDVESLLGDLNSTMRNRSSIWEY